MVESSRSLPAGRKAKIAAYVTENGQVTVNALARAFNVSPDTIRRDLDQLDSEGALIRTHGGAMSTSAVPWHDTQLDDRLRLRPQEKDTIGRLAASLVEDGNVLLINGGTTTLRLAHHLQERRSLIVATNSLLLPSTLNADSCQDVYLLGGRIRLSGSVTIGPVSFPHPSGNAALELSADLALLAVGAVATTGFSTTNLAEATMIATMAQRARKVAILADSSKFSRQLFATIGRLDIADYLITDAPPPAELRTALTENNVKILCPSPHFAPKIKTIR